MTFPKSRRRTREPRVTFKPDEFGVMCAYVPLADGLNVATIWKEDYDRIKQVGVSANWQLNDNGNGAAYVRAYRPGVDRVTIARLVLGGDSEGLWVRYVNGDRLDLRRPNLTTGRVPDERRAHSREASLFWAY